MKTPCLIAASGLLLAGCTSLERPATDMALGAGGGLLAHELSGGDPALTAVGAVGGVALGEGIHALRTRQQQKAFGEGYTRGRADGIKSVYWDLVEQQRNPSAQSKSESNSQPTHP
jgi:hypothetical protein